MEEKHDKGLRDFSGSKSDDLERRLQVLCLPKLSKGVVYDVQEVCFSRESLASEKYSYHGTEGAVKRRRRGSVNL